MAGSTGGNRSYWFLAFVSACTAVLVWRVVGLLLDFGFAWLGFTSPGEIVWGLGQVVFFREPLLHIRLLFILMVVFGALCIQNKLLLKAKPWTKGILGIIFFALALFPIQVTIVRQTLPVEFGQPEVSRKELEIEPVTLTLSLKLVRGEQIEQEAMVTRENVTQAYLVESETRPGEYEVEVELDDDGSGNLRKATSENIGNRMAIFLDEDLVACPKILSVVSRRFRIPLKDASAQEAKQIAKGLMLER